ncbi:MAG TPA: DNA phosphorothioation system sulfurtransferase DndC [Bryobacteraceae bacterium]|nr:DNA phosphorothioation system sulfurtransferase DndC [Bryobacteraceae bacterium]
MSTAPKSTKSPEVPKAKSRKSAFTEHGLNGTVDQLCTEIRELYLADNVPWIVGYSGGKDSTATLQLVWRALRELPEDKRTKTVYVISTDTLVENPVVAAWVTRSLEVMEGEAMRQRMPIATRRLTPETEESFWVNLIGKGYPAPRRKFRWCTERLKIRPSNRFIMSVVSQNGEAILLLGARKAESSVRAHIMERNTKYRVRDRLSPNPTLPGCMVYTPVEDWSNDDVWMFLQQIPNPWGHNNKELLGMYAGATADGECPLVVDTSTPSCGDSRFGCWVCTLVEKDKSMAAMVQNDQEKEWMLPLLELRNALDFRNNAASVDEDSSDHHLRDFRRMSGVVQLMYDGQTLVPGPYTQEARERWLQRLLEAQAWIQKNGPKDVRGFELISIKDLQEIRRIWVVEKHELEDNLPRIYERAMETKYPRPSLDDGLAMEAEDIALLRATCGDDKLHFQLTRELLSVVRQNDSSHRRAGHYDRLEKAFVRHFFKDAEDAADYARRRKQVRDQAENGELPPSDKPESSQAEPLF